MRITNSMMTRNSLNNINLNKIALDRLDTQMSTLKKISRPSDDPVVAIRALRLRSNVSELTQYYEKNIKDATSLLEVTEDTLVNIRELIRNMYESCQQGATDTLTAEDRNTIVTNLTSLKEQVYGEGNADYAGRNLLTGYKTNTDLTFSQDATVSYNITETFTGSDVESFTYVGGALTIDKNNITSVDSSTVTSNTVYRLRLAYDQLDSGTPPSELTYVDSSGTTQSISLNVCDPVTDDAYLTVDPDGINYLPGTGELILGENIYKQLQGLTGDGAISFSYDKTEFKKGDLRPEHYFDCTDNTNGVTYEKTAQAIEYTINFNQKIKVNTEASDVLTHDIGRDIDEILEAVSDTVKAEEKVATIKAMIEDPQYADQVTELNTMLEAAQKELDLKEDKMEKLFSAGMTKFQNYQTIADLQVTDVGSRVKRIELTENRLSAQKTSFEKLQSENENVELADVTIEFSAAELAYKASLTAAGRIVTNTLLDFI